jgi:hypothetical protein
MKEFKMDDKPDMKPAEIGEAISQIKARIAENAPMLAQAKQAMDIFEKLSSITSVSDSGLGGVVDQLKEDHPPARLTLEDAMAQNNYTIDEILVFIVGLNGKYQEAIAYKLKHLTGVQ